MIHHSHTVSCFFVLVDAPTKQPSNQPKTNKQTNKQTKKLTKGEVLLEAQDVVPF
jgi:hypothetical protein